MKHLQAAIGKLIALAQDISDRRTAEVDYWFSVEDAEQLLTLLLPHARQMTALLDAGIATVEALWPDQDCNAEGSATTLEAVADAFREFRPPAWQRPAWLHGAWAGLGLGTDGAPQVALVIDGTNESLVATLGEAGIRLEDVREASSHMPGTGGSSLPTSRRTHCSSRRDGVPRREWIGTHRGCTHLRGL